MCNNGDSKKGRVKQRFLSFQCDELNQAVSHSFKFLNTGSSSNSILLRLTNNINSKVDIALGADLSNCRWHVNSAVWCTPYGTNKTCLL